MPGSIPEGWPQKRQASMKRVGLNRFSCQVAMTAYHSSILLNPGCPDLWEAQHQFFPSSQSKLYSWRKSIILLVNIMLFQFSKPCSTSRTYCCRGNLSSKLLEASQKWELQMFPQLLLYGNLFISDKQISKGKVVDIQLTLKYCQRRMRNCIWFYLKEQLFKIC